MEVGSVKRVIVFLPPTMGDCVHHLATLRWLRDGLLGRRIVAVSSGLGLEVLRTWPVEGVEVWDRRSLYWKLVWGRFHLAIFPYVQNKLLRAARAAGIRRLVGVFGGKHDSWFATGVERQPGEHQVLDLSRRLFGCLGVACGSAVDGISARDSGMVRNRIGLMTGASRTDKKWDRSNFLVVAESLREAGFEVMNFGGPDEVGAIPGVLESAGVGLAEAARELVLCQVLITNDTGLMHVAGLLGVPVRAVFMVESPEEYYPPGDGHRFYVCDATVAEVLEGLV